MFEDARQKRQIQTDRLRHGYALTLFTCVLAHIDDSFATCWLASIEVTDLMTLSFRGNLKSWHRGWFGVCRTSLKNNEKKDGWTSGKIIRQLPCPRPHKLRGHLMEFLILPSGVNRSCWHFSCTHVLYREEKVRKIGLWEWGRRGGGEREG